MIKKGDIFIFIAVIALAAASLLSFSLIRSEGAAVKVTVNGEVKGIYLLNEDRTEMINTEKGYNILVIKDGKASVTDADCRDHICVGHPAIDSVGEAIVCLPHGLIAEVVESE